MAAEAPFPVCTIGHSTRSIEEFVELLRAGPADMVVDIRTVPRSRTNPQYEADALPEALANYQIGYMRIPALGGLRGKSAGLAPETNGLWRNASFHNYADYALSEDFEAALAKLIDLSSDRRCAIMCAEAVWWRCHRRIVADYLMLHGRTVLHLMGTERVDPAKMTPGAVPERERIRYPG